VSDPLIGGLAAGKHKVLQVSWEADQPITIFDYYTEYGDEGVTAIMIVDPNGGGGGYVPDGDQNPPCVSEAFRRRRGRQSNL